MENKLKHVWAVVRQYSDLEDHTDVLGVYTSKPLASKELKRMLAAENSGYFTHYITKVKLNEPAKEDVFI